MRNLPPNLAPLGYSPSRYLPLSLAYSMPDLLVIESLVIPGMFANGVNGFWFDPSDMATLFQDATGLIPVTAADQPVGLMLDKSVLQRHPARRNLFHHSVDFDNTGGELGWFLAQCTQTKNAVTAPDGSTTAHIITMTGTSPTIMAIVNVVAGVTYTASIKLKGVAGSIGKTSVFWNWYVGSATGSSVMGEYTLTDDWGQVICTFTPTGSGTAYIRLDVEGFGGVGVIDHVVHVCEPQLEIGSTPTDYQKVTTGTPGNWTPGNHASQSTDAKRPMLRTDGRLWWLEFDGVDDEMPYLGTLDSSQSMVAIASYSRTDTFNYGNMLSTNSVIMYNRLPSGFWGGHNNVDVASSYIAAMIKRVMVQNSRAVNNVDLWTDFYQKELKTNGSSYSPRENIIGYCGYSQSVPQNFYGAVVTQNNPSDDTISKLITWLATKIGVTHV